MFLSIGYSTCHWCHVMAHESFEDAKVAEILMQYYEKHNQDNAMKMVEKTLMQIYRGGIFDHIGGGFSRYSTDRYFLVPHFEKMLYEAALDCVHLERAKQFCDKAIAEFWDENHDGL